MFGILSVVFFAISFILHWAGGGKSPFDVTGFMLLGLTCLAVHVLWPWRPWSHP